MLNPLNPSAKNALSSPALSDLGLGDQVAQQLQDQLAERQKKALTAAGGNTSGMTDQQARIMGMSPSVQMLFGDTR